MKEKGKNFSCNNLGQRRKSDFYETPYSITQQFIDRESISKNYKILEPSSGNGAIVKVLKKNDFNNVIAKDIIQGNDFLQETEPYDYIITNPPFSLAFEFIQKAKTLCNRFSFLLPLSYLHGKKRYDTVYSDKTFPLSHIYVFTRYPMLGEELREDGKYNTGMVVYSWFTWDKNAEDAPFIKWIDNNSFVLTKEDKK